jgi:WD40 repeat protein
MKSFSSARLLAAGLLVFASAALAAERAGQIRLLEGHEGSVLSIEFSPDGRTLVSGSRDHTIKVWDPATGQLQRTLGDHTLDVYAAVFSPKGDLLASAGKDRTIRIWDTRSFNILKTLEGHTDIVRAVAFSPDQQTLASASVDLTVRLWDLATGKLKQTLNGHTERVKSLVYAHDGTWIASAATDKTIRIWDTATGTQKALLQGHTKDIETLALSPDGKVLASSSGDTTVRLWDVASGKEVRKLEGHTEEVDSVAFSPNGSELASGCKDKTIKLWDAATGKLLRTIEGHTGRIESLCYSPDGRMIASGGGGGDSSIRLWDVGDLVAAAGPEKAKPRTAVEDRPGLPRVLIIGDSISIGYTQPVRDLLKDKANVHRIPANGGPTKNGVSNIDKWLGDGKWDVIHFNFGIHDLKFMPDGKRQVEPQDYEKNLRLLVAKMKATGARLIWATTTPIPEGDLVPPRSFGKVPEYNAIAQRVMADSGVSIDDLNAVITPHLAEVQTPKDVHYKPEGYARLAKQVAASIEAALAAPR